VRVLLAASRSPKGDVDANLAAHQRHVDAANSASCSLALFPEMSLTGSVDPVAHPEWLVTLDDARIATLVETAAALGIAICFGVAERAATGAHITQIMVDREGRTTVQRKRHLGEGEDSFVPGTRDETFDVDDVRVAVAICAEAGHDAPFDAAADAGARLVLFPAAPGLFGRRDSEESWRRGFAWWEASSLADARRHAQRLGLWVALAGQSGSTVDEDFPGLAALVSPDGDVVDRLPDWREGTLVVDVPL
jgi:predicted amidohydrolase